MQVQPYRGNNSHL